MRRVEGSNRMSTSDAGGAPGGGMWLNESLDVVSRKTLPTLAARLAVGVVAGLMTIAYLGWRPGVVWSAANLTAETWTWFSSGPQRLHPHQSRRQRIWYLASIVWMNCVWSSLAIWFWMHGEPSLRICAVCLLACQMLHASIFNAQSNALVLAVGGIPAASLIGLCALDGGDLGRFRLMVAAAAVLMIAYLAKAASVSRANARALEASMAEAIAANQAKSEFLALMSHELRTPMTGVLGMASALATQPMPPDQKQQVEVLVKSGNALLTLVNDILDLSKVEAGKLDLEAEPFDLALCVAAVDDLWREAAKAKGLAFECRIDAEDARWVVGDETRLRQVMTNLVSNALKFTQAGRVALAVALGPAGADGRADLSIAVSDTGIGMSDAEQARLFRPFTQADASVTRRFGGTGLGLSICRRLVTAMGGDISVSSAPGEGSTFRVSVALAVASAPPEAERADDVIDLQGLRVLFADDNEVNRLVGKTLLGAFGCEVATVDDGDAAVAYLAGAAVDVVLLDIHMPRVGGFEALARIRANGLVGRDVPVIALTADVLPQQVLRLKAAGFDGVESKPIDAMRLAQLIGALCMAAKRDVGAALSA
jgi:two-component system, sensor histidine kinase